MIKSYEPKTLKEAKKEIERQRAIKLKYADLFEKREKELLQQIDSLKRDNQWTHEANTRQTEALFNLQKFAKELWEEYQLLAIPSKVGPVYRKVFDRLTMILGLERDWMLLANLDLTCDKSKEPPCHLEPTNKLCQKCSLNKNQEAKP